MYKYKFIGGEFSEDNYMYIIFKVKRCSNKTSKIRCASEEEFKSKNKEGLYYDTVMLKSLVNPKKYRDPVVRNYEYHYRRFDGNLLSIQRNYFEKANIKSDINPLFNTWVNQKFVEFSSEIRETTAFGGENDIYFHKIYLINTIKHYERVYIKIPAITARVGGFLNLFMFFVNYIFNLYMDNEYNIYMINNLMKLEFEEDNFENYKSKIFNNTNIPNSNELVHITNFGKSLPNTSLNMSETPKAESPYKKPKINIGIRNLKDSSILSVNNEFQQIIDRNKKREPKKNSKQ